jgi:hypothetical protein
MVYLVTLTFSWFSKVHFGFFSLKCKSWSISVVFCCGLPCQSYILFVFQSSFWISFVEMQELEYFSSVLSWFTVSHLNSLDVSLKCESWNISVVFCCGLRCQSYILLIFQSSFWISLVEMQELEYFSSFFSWFTVSQLHSLDFLKFILNFFRWNARVGIFQ